MLSWTSMHRLSVIHNTFWEWHLVSLHVIPCNIVFNVWPKQIQLCHFSTKDHPNKKLGSMKDDEWNGYIKQEKGLRLFTVWNSRNDRRQGNVLAPRFFYCETPDTPDISVDWVQFLNMNHPAGKTPQSASASSLSSSPSALSGGSHLNTVHIIWFSTRVRKSCSQISMEGSKPNQHRKKNLQKIQFQVKITD